MLVNFLFWTLLGQRETCEFPRAHGLAHTHTHTHSAVCKLVRGNAAEAVGSLPQWEWCLGSIEFRGWDPVILIVRSEHLPFASICHCGNADVRTSAKQHPLDPCVQCLLQGWQPDLQWRLCASKGIHWGLLQRLPDDGIYI